MADVHIAEIIEDELRERGWNRDVLASKMNPCASAKEWQLTRLSLDFLLDTRETSLTIDKCSAEGFSRAFGVDPQFFINLHEAWRKRAEPAAPGETKEESEK